MLDHGERYPRDIRFLESVHSEVLHAGLPGEHDHGDRVHLCREDAGDGVGGPGARGDQDHSRPPAGAGKAVRHVGGPLLVAGQDKLDGRVYEGVEQRDCGAPGEAEDVLHPLLLQYVHHRLGAREGALRLRISHVETCPF